MDYWLIFAVFLYLICAALIIAEVFVPSGGVISVMALFALAGGLVIFFRHSVTVGIIGIVVAVIMIPTVLVMAFKILPKTAFGKNVNLEPPKRQLGDAIPDTDRIKNLLGQIGVAISPLRPIGMCDFSGKRIECVAESGYVEKGKKVKVIRVQQTQLTVRVIDES
jgi:membrane-bound ClpP family serine protease